MKPRLLALLLCGAADLMLVSGNTATAATVVMDFDSTPSVWGYQTGNLEIEGFRVSPSRHVDIIDYGTGSGTGWNVSGASVAMGWDGGANNPAYLGSACENNPAPYTSCVYIDLAGQTFSLLSMIHWGYGMLAESSKGGFAAITTDGYRDLVPTLYTFSSPEWQDIEWIVIHAGEAAGAPQQFVDDLTFQVVPIPAAVWLFGGALTGLGAIGRRQKT